MRVTAAFVVDDLICNMAEGKQVDAIVMDFSKAFDVVPHGSLIVKLKHYGIRNSTLKWIDAFLTDRTQRVAVDGEHSAIAPVTSGVPQGSVLGPVLFLAYINDLPECIDSKSRLFADDTIVYRTIDSPDDCVQLQEDLRALEKWETKWGMSFNPSKCETIHVTRKRNPIVTPYILKNEELNVTTSACYLGVSISSDLGWNNHVTKTAAKGNRALGFVKRNVKTTSKLIKEKAYNTLVRPVLEYASSVWSPGQKGLSDILETVQKRAARYVFNYSNSLDSSSMLTHLEWDSLEQRRYKSRVTMMYKIVNSLVAIPTTKLVPTAGRTRGHSLKFHRIKTQRNYHLSSFFPSTIRLWNSLPPNLVTSLNLDVFKEGLKSVTLRLD